MKSISECITKISGILDIYQSGKVMNSNMKPETDSSKDQSPRRIEV